MTDNVNTDNDYGATSNTNDDGITNSFIESTHDSYNNNNNNRNNNNSDNYNRINQKDYNYNSNLSGNNRNNWKTARIGDLLHFLGTTCLDTIYNLHESNNVESIHQSQDLQKLKNLTSDRRQAINIITDRVEDRKGCTPYELTYNQQYTPNLQQFGIDLIIHITCVEEATTFGVKLNKTRQPIVLGFIVDYGNDSNTYVVQTIGNKPARKYTPDITVLNRIDNIKTYLNNLDSQQVEEASKIAEQLRDYDNPNFTTEPIPLQQELPPEEDFRLYTQLVDETGISEFYDFLNHL